MKSLRKNWGTLIIEGHWTMPISTIHTHIQSPYEVIEFQTLKHTFPQNSTLTSIQVQCWDTTSTSHKSQTKRRSTKTLDSPTAFTSQFTSRPASKALAETKQGKHALRGSKRWTWHLAHATLNPSMLALMPWCRIGQTSSTYIHNYHTRMD